MKKHAFFVLCVILFLPLYAYSQPFTIVGPRALGMGGASVAAVNDSSAVYWNPAALAGLKKLEIRIPAGAAFRDHISLQDKWDRIIEIEDLINAHDPQALNEFDQLLTELERPGTGTDLDANTGLYIAIPFSRSAIAISSPAFGYAGLYPTIDIYNRNTAASPPPPADSIVHNNSAVTGMGMITVEPTFSFATRLWEKVLIGVNAKMIYASTFIHSENIRIGDIDNFIDNLDASRTDSNKAGLDAGIVIKLTESLSIGVVGRNLNSPSFPISGYIAQRQDDGDVTTIYTDGELELEPQYRAGVAFRPVSYLTLSADYDISKNKSIGIPGYEDQTAAAGLEITLPKEIISIRGGVYKNQADSDSNPVYTAGLGIRLFFLRVDVAGAYDFREQEAQVAASLALRF